MYLYGIALPLLVLTNSKSLVCSVRTRQRSGLIAALRSSSGADNLVLELRGGQPCLSLSLQHDSATYTAVCLPVSANDGHWHQLQAFRLVAVSQCKMYFLYIQLALQHISSILRHWLIPMNWKHRHLINSLVLV